MISNEVEASLVTLRAFKLYKSDASKTILAAAIVEFLALGCGLIIIPFLVFKDINVLNIAVDVGFVVGITAAIIPIGSAIFVIPKASSFSITPHVFVSLYQY